MGAFVPLVRWDTTPPQAAAAPAVRRDPDPKATQGAGSLSVRLALSRGGQPLPNDLRRPFERSFNADFGRVRLHSDPESNEQTAAAGAEAMTDGRDVFFAAGRYQPETLSGRFLVAHELAHVAQTPTVSSAALQVVSSPADAHERAAEGAALAAGSGLSVGSAGLGTAPAGMVHRYKSFEHAEAGLIGTYVGPEFSDYVVKRGELPAAIAANFHISEEQLVAANPSLLRRWKTRSGHVIAGFEEGARIMIPTGRLATRQPSKTEVPTPAPNRVTIGGTTVSYEELLPMADYYETPDAMVKADATEFARLRQLVKDEAKSPTSVTEDMWQAPTEHRPEGQRYMDLNRRNREHFAPAKGAPLVAVVGLDNRSTWHFYHHQAIAAARAGDLNQALAINAFADHFLQDAFASGHLIDKTAVMASVTRQLSTPRQVTAFATSVAQEAWKNPGVVAECDRYQGSKYGGWWNINQASDLGSILEAIGTTHPDVLPNAIAGAIHDDLNKAGVEVRNRFTSWTAHGDGSIGPEDREMMRRAVAESYVQVLNAAKSTTPQATLDQAVWSIVPEPTAAGQTAVDAAVARLINPTANATILAVATMLIQNIGFILRSGAAEPTPRLRLKKGR